MIACIGLVARATQNKKSIRKSEINLEGRNQLGNQKSTWKSEINLEIRNQSLEIRNQVRNHGDLKSRTLLSKVSYPLSQPESQIVSRQTPKDAHLRPENKLLGRNMKIKCIKAFTYILNRNS